MLRSYNTELKYKKKTVNSVVDYYCKTKTVDGEQNVAFFRLQEKVCVDTWPLVKIFQCRFK